MGRIEERRSGCGDAGFEPEGHTPAEVERADHAALAREDDARQERMDRVAVLYGEITAATREFLRAVAECDRHRDWAEEGFASCTDWLAWRIGVTRNVAGEKLRAARALERLPMISASMERGEISFSKVRALTRAATSENEAELLGYAKACSAASLERLVRGWKTLGRVEGARADRLRHRMRSFSVFPNNEGMFVVKGVVTPEVGALLQRAIEAAGDALFAATAAEDGERPEPAQLRADALALVAERALAAGFGRGGDGEHAPISGTSAERYQVMLHVEPASLAEHGEPGMSELEDGSRLSAESARRIACDASVTAVERDGCCAQGGAVPGRGGEARVGAAAFELGRRTRTVPPSIRRALEARDRGCRFPGCRLRFTDAHHIVHWADGGGTGLHNLILLCARHHRAVHEGGLQVCLDKEATVVFFAPGGRAIAEAAPMPGLAEDPLDALVARNRARGVSPNWRSGRQEYRRDADVPWEIEASALEAMDRVLEGLEEDAGGSTEAA